MFRHKNQYNVRLTPVLPSQQGFPTVPTPPPLFFQLEGTTTTTTYSNYKLW